MYIFKLIRQFKAATGRSPTPNELSKLKQQAEAMSAQENIIQFPEGGIDSVPVDKQFGNKKSLKEFTEAEDIYETETEMLKRMNRQNKESVERLKKKKEKDLGDKLKDYDGDPDAMAMGGRAGFNVGGIARLLKFLQGKVGKKNITTADKIARPESALNREMFDEANKRFNKKVNERTSNKAGQGRFTKAQLLIARLENTIKTDKNPFVQRKFPEFIKELKAKPELGNNKNVYDFFMEQGSLPKNQRVVEYDDGTVDFYTQGGKGMESVDLLAKDLGISLDESAKIKMMEPEDQILEIQRRKTLKKFDTTNRKLNAAGGLAYMLGEEPRSEYGGGGLAGAPPVTYDDNIDNIGPGPTMPPNTIMNTPAIDPRMFNQGTGTGVMIDQEGLQEGKIPRPTTQGLADGGRPKYGIGNLVKEKIPPEYRLYAKSILPGGESGKVDESYFTEDFKKTLRTQALEKFKLTGELKGSVNQFDQIRGFHNRDEELNKLVGMPSTYASLGAYSYEIDPKTLDVKIKDRYDWNPSYGKIDKNRIGFINNKEGRDVDLTMMKDFAKNAIKEGRLDKANALELIGNYFGGKESQGTGFDVDINIPTQEATTATEGSFAQGGRIGYAEGTEEPLKPINIGIGTFNPQRVVDLYEKAKNIPKNISSKNISLEDIKSIPKRLMEGTKSSISSMVEPLGNEYRAYMEFFSLPEKDKKKMEEMGLGIFDVFEYLAMRDNKAQGGRIGFDNGSPREFDVGNFRELMIQDMIKKSPDGIVMDGERDTFILDSLREEDGDKGLDPSFPPVEYDDGTIYYPKTDEYYKIDGTQVDGISPGAKPVPKVLEAAQGGRIGFKDGGMDRRGFLKLMGGLAALPIVGKFFKGAKVASKVVPLKGTTTAMPAWFPDLVDKFVAKGVGKKIDQDLMEYTTKDLPGIKMTKHDDGKIYS